MTQFHVSSILVRLGVLLFGMDRGAEGLPYLQRALELRTKKNGPEHGTVKDVRFGDCQVDPTFVRLSFFFRIAGPARHRGVDHARQGTSQALRA